ncbi:Uncharacterised protein [Haemophilus influenzae]|nr:Uncharacterised protein [Haemophilus influenzae]
MSFDKSLVESAVSTMGLNPFGTGQCLSTFNFDDVLDTVTSQSLWNRAMSFDSFKFCY